MSCPPIPTACNPGSFLVQQALCDVYSEVSLWGHDVQLRVRTEADVTRDRYNSVKTQETVTPIDLKAMPIDFQPNRYRLEKAGLFEEAEVSIWIPSYAFLLQSLPFEDIDLRRCSFYITGSLYNIKEKSRVGQFQNSWLYYTFGLARN
jgi:hypothetical protein